MIHNHQPHAIDDMKAAHSLPAVKKSREEPLRLLVEELESKGWKAADPKRSAVFICQ